MNRHFLLLAIATAACDVDTSGTGTGSETDADTDTDMDSDSDSDSDSDTEGAIVTGQLVGPDGEGRRSNIQLCDISGCRFGTVGEGGVFRFMGAFPSGPYWFYSNNTGAEAPTNATILLPEGPAEVVRTVRLVDGSWSDVPDVAAPISVPGGLSITLGKDTVSLFDTRDVRAGGVRVDLDQLVDVDYPGPVVAAWYLRPFEAAIKEGKTVPFSITADWEGAEDGKTYDLYSSFYTWERLGSGSLEGGVLEGELTSDNHVSSIYVIEASD